MALKATDRDFYMVAVILVIVGIFGFIAYMPSRFETQFAVKMSEFPKVVGEWSSEDIVISDRVFDLLETRNVIMRDYMNLEKDKVNFTVVYALGNRKVSHPPEICLQGEGATIVDKTPIMITDSIEAMQLTTEQHFSRELVVYWYKAGGQNTTKYLKNQLKISIDALHGKKTSSALIRLLTVVEDDKVEEAIKRIKTFAILIEPLLDRYIP